MGFTHHKGISVSNLVASTGTIKTLTGTTFTGTNVRATTKVSTPLVQATTKMTSPTINASTNFNLKSVVVKATKGFATYGSLSDGSGFAPAVGDSILRAFQWKYSTAGIRSASQITATTKIKGAGIISFATPLLSGSTVLIDFLDKT
jgi:hypothetical protein